MAQFRYDRGTLDAPRVTPQGYYQVDGYASRVGVQVYRLPDGSTRRELRLPEDVFDAKSLEGFRGLPITDDHPSAMLTIENTTAIARGTSLAPGEQAGELVKFSGQVTDAGLLAKMKAGKKQLSVGYGVDLEMTAGVHPKYGAYDAIQRNIVPNHLAVVDVGRAGPKASVRMDAQFAADAGIAVEAEHCNLPSLFVSSRELSATQLVERVATLLAAIDGISIVQSRTSPSLESANGDRGDDDEDLLTVWSASCASVQVSSADMSAADLDAIVAPVLRGDGALVLGNATPMSSGAPSPFPQPAVVDSARRLQVAKRVPKSANNDATQQHSEPTVNLAEALAALNATNVKLGAEQAARADAEARATAAEQARKDAETARATAEAERDNAKADAEREKIAGAQAKTDAEASIEKARVDAEAARAADVAIRVDVLTKANAVLGAVDDKKQPIDRTALSNRAIKAAVIKKVDGLDVDDKQHEAYVDAMFDGACRRHSAGAGALASTRVAIVDGQNKTQVPSAGDAEAKAAAKLREDQANRWMTPSTQESK